MTPRLVLVVDEDDGFRAEMRRCLAERQLAWELDAEGSWRRVPPQRGLAVQQELARRATERSRSEP